MPSNPSQTAGHLSPGFVLRYLIGAVIVLGGLIATSIATGHTLSNLVSTAKGVPACGAVANPDCLASYPATVEQLQPSTQTSNVTVVLHTSFLASTDDRDECFGTACVDFVPVAGDVSNRLAAPEQVRITAGDGRVVSIATALGTVTTQDAPRVAILDVVADLTWGLYLVALTALFAGGYVVLAIRTALWRIHPLRWLRAVTALQVLTGVLALAAFIGFAIGGSTALVSLAVVLLAGFVSSHVARLHARPSAAMPTSGPTSRQVAFADRHWGSLTAAFYVLAAFPIPIGVDVALQLRHDGYSSIGVVITVLISAALGGFLLVKAYQVMHRGRRSPAHAAVS